MTTRRRGLLAIAAVAIVAAVGFLLSAPPPAAAPEAVRAITKPPPRHTPPGITAVRLVDERGRPVAGVPVWTGDGTLNFTLSEGNKNGGALLGRSDADGLFIPDGFPVEINVAPWPAAPTSLTVTDDGREHLLTVSEACPVELSWDDPGDPNITDIRLALAFSTPVAHRRATLHLPCGTLDVSTWYRSPPRVEPDPDEIDTREGAAHISWRDREGVGICVTDETGTALPQGEVPSAWRDGDCWRYPYLLCAEIRAEGFLSAEMCPDAGWLGWIWDRYDVALERGVEVVLRCEGGECPERMGIVQCISDQSPDHGVCGAGRCTCPDAADARAVASGGPFAGESAPVKGGIADFARTGTATLVVHGLTDEGILLRSERDSELLVGRLRGDGVRKQLPAGTYQVMVAGEEGTVEMTGIRLKEGEFREVTFFTPEQEVEVRWLDDRGKPLPGTEYTLLLVEATGLRATWWRPPARVVPGATLWTCIEAGCCRFIAPGGSVTCTPDPELSPPLR